MEINEEILAWRNKSRVFLYISGIGMLISVFFQNIPFVILSSSLFLGVVFTLRLNIEFSRLFISLVEYYEKNKGGRKK